MEAAPVTDAEQVTQNLEASENLEVLVAIAGGHVSGFNDSDNLGSRWCSAQLECTVVGSE